MDAYYFVVPAHTPHCEAFNPATLRAGEGAAGVSSIIECLWNA